MAGRPYDPTAPGINPLTPQQQHYVNTQTQAALAPERAAILAAQKAAQRSALAQQARITGFAQAAAAQLSGALPRTQEAYNQAIQSQAGLSKGFSQAFQNQTGADQGAVDAQTALGNIPATAFAQDALSQYRQAAAQPATQYGLGQIGLRASAAQLADQQKQLLDQLVQVGAKAPALRQQIIQQLQQNELQKRATRDNEYALNIRADQAQVSASQGAERLRQSGQRIQLQDKSLQRQIKKDQQAGQQIDAAGSKELGYIRYKDGTVPKDPKTGRPIAIKQTSTSSRSSNPVTNLRGDATDLTEKILTDGNFSPSGGGAPSSNPFAIGGTATGGGRPDIAEIVASVLATTGPVKGLSRSRQKAIIRQVVVNAIRARGYNVGKKPAKRKP